VLADALERLIVDRERSRRRSGEGIEFVASHTWEHATDEVEAGLRHALRERESTGASAGADGLRLHRPGVSQP